MVAGTSVFTREFQQKHTYRPKFIGFYVDRNVVLASIGFEGLEGGSLWISKDPNLPPPKGVIGLETENPTKFKNRQEDIDIVAAGIKELGVNIGPVSRFLSPTARNGV